MAWNLHGKAVRRVGDPSFVTAPTISPSVVDGTHSHNLPQQGTAHVGARAPRRTVISANFIARAGLDQAGVREGWTPNGRDGIAGTGQRPRARRHEVPTRPRFNVLNEHQQ